MMDHFIIRLQDAIWSLYNTRIRIIDDAARNLLMGLNTHVLHRSQRWERKYIEDYQNRKLSGIIAHAYQHVPFYRKWFDAYGIDPKNIKTAADLNKIPYITKSDIRAVPPEERVANNLEYSRFIKTATAGSSGNPLTFWWDTKSDLLWNPLWRRTLSWYGIDIAERKALIGLFGGIPFSNTHISIFDLSKKPGSVLEKLSRDGAKILIGYASGLVELAALSQRFNHPLHFKKILSCAEELSDEHRDFVERAFVGVAFRFYASMEFGFMGQECIKRDGYHINEESIIVDIDKSENAENAYDSDVGSVIVTSLTSETMPFIRYKIGDVGYLKEEPCACGSYLKRLYFMGREAFYIEGRNRKIHESEFHKVLKQYFEIIKEFQIISVSRGEVYIKVVAGNMPSFVKNKIIENLKKQIDPKMEYFIEETPSIERSAGGKIIHLLSHKI